MIKYIKDRSAYVTQEVSSINGSIVADGRNKNGTLVDLNRILEKQVEEQKQ